MCTPNAYAAAKAVGKARNDMTVEGVNLNNLKDAPRQLALPSNMQFKPLPGISVSDPARQYQG